MAQDNIHPEQHEVTIVMTNGTKFKTMTTHGKAGATIKLDIDPFNHPAWKKGEQGFVNVNDNQVSKFNKKFGNFDFSLNNKKDKKEE